MNQTIHTLPTHSRSVSTGRTSVETFRQPGYDCQEHVDAMKLVVYVPGVGASGVDIEGRDADLTVTARKQRFVRVNFHALHLENVQLDYQLRLRLGHGFDFAAMEAEIHDGVLTITLPKRGAVAAPAPRLRRVA
jgi:HSP20 family protein